MKFETTDGREIEIGMRKATGALVGVSESRSMSWFWPFVREASAGAWQRNEEITVDNALSNPTLYACVTLIASDIAKLRPRLMERDKNGIWSEFENAAWSPILRRPNHYQNWLQFVQWWMTSKYTNGNTYALKRRDRRGVVTGAYILDPTRVKLLQAPDGSFFYELSPSNASQLGLPQNEQVVIVPAREIMHDVCCPLFHPMIGVSPIFAAGWPALLARYIQNNSQKLSANGSSPGGVITATGTISDVTARRVKAYFEDEFTGDNYGKVAVLGDGLTYTPMSMATAVDSQVIEILRWTDEQIAKPFHMPMFKVGGPLPPYSSVEAVTQIYYSDCLQTPVAAFEQVFTDGLELPQTTTRMSLDIDDLNRMDSATTIDMMTKGVQGSVFTNNEARRKFDLPPLKGGDTIYMQIQDKPIESLADLQEKEQAAAAMPPQEPEPDGEDADKVAAFGSDLKAHLMKNVAVYASKHWTPDAAHG